MFEIWEIVKINDFEFLPLLLVDKTEDIEKSFDIKNKKNNYILTDDKGNLIDVKK